MSTFYLIATLAVMSYGSDFAFFKTQKYPQLTLRPQNTASTYSCVNRLHLLHVLHGVRMYDLVSGALVTLNVIAIDGK